MKSKNALNSLWGSGNAEALAKVRTRDCVAMPGLREQTIRTPAIVVAGISKVWPEGIALDPCSCEGSLVNAARVVRLPACGLEETWVDFTYVNPPYGKLKLWLEKASSSVKESGGSLELIMLIPVRSHRKWWRETLLKPGVTLCWMNPLKFEGFSQAFPAPLVLAYFGTRVSEFKTAFKSLGGFDESR